MSRRVRSVAVAVVVVASVLATVPGAGAALPGRDANLVYEQSLALRYEPQSASFALASATPDGRSVTQLRYCRGVGPTTCCPPFSAVTATSYCPGAHPAVSPDGRRLFAVWGRGFSTYMAALSFSNADGSDLTIPDPAIATLDGSWSPDGRRVVFTRPRDQEGYATGFDQATDLWLVGADGSGVRRLTLRGGSQPSWSARGEIAFVRNGDLYVVRPDGAGLRRLTRRGGIQPDWSPDGRTLAFIRGTGDLNLFTVGRDGRGLRQLTRADAYAPAWSPSGRWIAFVRNGIALISPRGGRPRRILVGAQTGNPARIAWQPLPALRAATRPAAPR